MMVRFYEKEVEDRKSTKELGRKVMKTVEMVEIQFPGNSKFSPHYPAHEPTVTYSTLVEGEDDMRTWAERFPEAYKAFRAGGDQNTGTPLDELMELTRAEIAMLKAIDIVSVEQLAQVADTHIKKLPVDYAKRDAAKALLEARKAAPTADQMAEEMDELRAEIARLKETPRRGRPPKSSAEPEEVDAA